MGVLTPFRRWFAASPPNASIEIAADRVTGVTLGWDAVVTGVVSEPLMEGILTPTANATNVIDPDALRDTVRKVRQALPGAPTRVALVVPDAAAKVSLMTFEQIPARSADLDELVRWQARKTAPFRIEDAQVAYAAGLPTEAGGREFVVSLMRRDIVEEYESACRRAGGHAGVVDLASFSLINAVLAGRDTGELDWLLVHVALGYSSIAVVRHGQLVLFRNRPADREDDLVDLVHQTTMYYEDRLKGTGFGRVYLAASEEQTTSEHAAILRKSLQSRLGVRVSTIAIGDTSDDVADVHPDLMAAPWGMLLREHRSMETPS